MPAEVRLPCSEIEVWFSDSFDRELELLESKAQTRINRTQIPFSLTHEAALDVSAIKGRAEPDRLPELGVKRLTSLSHSSCVLASTIVDSFQACFMYWLRVRLSRMK